MAEEEAITVPPTALELLTQAVASVPGIHGCRIEGGEIVAQAARDSIVGACST